MPTIRPISFALLVALSSSTSWAQTTAITDIPTTQNTTISIKKGDSGSVLEKTYEIVEGTAQIEGDPSVLAKEARANWKKACGEWKKEIKELNQDNKVMAMDCGKVLCTNQGSEGQACSSEGRYKIKTKIK